MRADPGLTEDELVRLGTRLRHVSGRDIRFRTVPVANPSYRAAGAGAVALWDAGAAAGVFTAMREDTARPHHGAGRDGAGRPTVEPAQIRVQVYNGGGTAGLGSLANADLAARGFATAGPAQNWSRTGVARTTIRFDTRYTESIKTVAAALPGARLVAVAGLGRTMQVVVGTSYDGAQSRAARGPRGCRHRRPHRGRPRLQLTDPQGVDGLPRLQDRLPAGQPVGPADLRLTDPAAVLGGLGQHGRDLAGPALGVHRDEHEVGRSRPGSAAPPPRSTAPRAPARRPPSRSARPS